MKYVQIFSRVLVGLFILTSVQVQAGTHDEGSDFSDIIFFKCSNPPTTNSEVCAKNGIERLTKVFGCKTSTKPESVDCALKNALNSSDYIWVCKVKSDNCLAFVGGPPAKCLDGDKMLNVPENDPKTAMPEKKLIAKIADIGHLCRNQKKEQSSLTRDDPSSATNAQPAK